MAPESNKGKSPSKSVAWRYKEKLLTRRAKALARVERRKLFDSDDLEDLDDFSYGSPKRPSLLPIKEKLVDLVLMPCASRFLWVRHKRVIPVPQLQPLDARDIIKHREMAARVVARAAMVKGATRAAAAKVADSLRPPLPDVHLPEVPDMIVFSDDDIDWDDYPNWWDDPCDWVDFLDWDDDFVPFEVLKKC